MKTFFLVATIFLSAELSLSAQVRWLSPTEFGSSNLHAAGAAPSGNFVVCGAGKMLFAAAGSELQASVVSAPEFVMNDVTAVSGSVFVAVGSIGQSLRSTDNGATWAASKIADVDLYRCAASGSDIYAVGRGGVVLRSANEGVAWSTVPAFTGEDLYALSFQGLTGVVVGSGGAVGRTGNGGASWSAVERLVDDDLRAVTLVTPQIGFAGGTSGTLYRTSDAGATWSSVYVDTNFAFQNIRFFAGGIGFALGASGRILRTSNGGTVWNAIPISGAQWINDAVQTNNTFMTVGDYGITALSNDAGASWNAALPPTVSGLFCIRYGVDQTVWAGGAHGTLLRGNGGSWNVVNSPADETLTALHTVPVLIAGTHEGSIYLSSNGGVEWQKAADASFSVTSIARFSGGGYVAVGAEGNIRISSNGSMWEPSPSGTTQHLLSVSSATASVGVAVGDSGVIIRTSDGGATWQTVQSGVNHALLAVDFSDDFNGWAVGNRGTSLRTSDGGLTWLPAVIDAEATWTALSFDRPKTTGALVSLHGDVYFSVDGSSWKKEAAAASIARDAAFRGNTVVGCGPAGLLFAAQSTLSTVDQVSPQRFTASICPVPAETFVELTVESLTPLPATVEFVSASGANLWYRNVELSQGISTFQFPCESLSSGMYVCRIAAQNYTLHLPFVVVK